MFTTVNDNDTLLNISELCQELQISQTSAYNLLRSGKIKAFKLAGWRIPAESIKRYIQNRLGEQ